MENGSGGYMGGEPTYPPSIMPIQMRMHLDMEFYGGACYGSPNVSCR